ncbi:MAG: hypothetical protein KBT34_12590 [Prevotella sp.]|nr:hypothetical protein [Candidatus Prevotella equi]
MDIKKTFIAIVSAIAMSMTANAQAVSAVEEVNVTPGTTAKVTVKLENTDFTGFQSDFVTTEGITVKSISRATATKVRVDPEDEESDYVYTVSFDKASKNLMIFTMEQEAFKSGDLYIINIDGAEGFEDGTITVKNIGADAAGKTSMLNDVVIKVVNATAADTVKGDNVASSDVRKVAKNNKLYIVKGEKESNVAGAMLK